jgi:hypothetical protein
MRLLYIQLSETDTLLILTPHLLYMQLSETDMLLLPLHTFLT